MNVLAGYIALLSIATTVVQIPYVDALSEAQAISMVALEIEVVEKTRKACGKLIPEAKRAFDYQALQWQLGNRTEIEAVDSFLATTDQDEFNATMAPFLDAATSVIETSIAALGSERVCGAYAQQISTGDRNVKTHTPKASAFLAAYVLDHPLSAEMAERYNMTTGCVLQHFNNGVDLDLAQSVCTCTTQVILAEFSREELDELDSVARARGEVQSLASFVRVGPKLALCRPRDQ